MRLSRAIEFAVRTYLESSFRVGSDTTIVVSEGFSTEGVTELFCVVTLPLTPTIAEVSAALKGVAYDLYLHRGVVVRFQVDTSVELPDRTDADQHLSSKKLVEMSQAELDRLDLHHLDLVRRGQGL